MTYDTKTFAEAQRRVIENYSLTKKTKLVKEKPLTKTEEREKLIMDEITTSINSVIKQDAYRLATCKIIKKSDTTYIYNKIEFAIFKEEYLKNGGKMEDLNFKTIKDDDGDFFCLAISKKALRR